MTTHYDQSQTERELREALSERAREVRPSSRLDEILREAGQPEPSVARGRWAVGIGVAAAAAVVAGVVWATLPDADPPLPGGTPSTTPTPTSVTSPPPSAEPTPSTSPSPSGSPSATASARPTAPAGTVATSLGIYLVGSNGGTQSRPGLVREFWTPGGGAPADLDARVTAAVRRSMGRTQVWQGTEVTAAEVTSGRITVRLAASSAKAPSEEAARLAATALAWTAQAVVGRGDVPVRVTTPDGSPVLGQVDSGTTFTRAGTPAEYLCDIWVDSPAPGASVGSSRAVVVRGQAVAFEANVEWELRRGGTAVRDGFTTASTGAPGRGAFSVDLGRLEAGTYTFSAFTSSAEDGSTVAEREVTFTVR